MFSQQTTATSAARSILATPHSLKLTDPGSMPTKRARFTSAIDFLRDSTLKSQNGTVTEPSSMPLKTVTTKVNQALDSCFSRLSQILGDDDISTNSDVSGKVLAIHQTFSNKGLAYCIPVVPSSLTTAI